MESYKHKYAKAVLVEWLRDAAKEEEDFFGLTFRTNRNGPNYGVWQEYLDDGRSAEYGGIWDENPEYYEPNEDDEIEAIIEEFGCDKIGILGYPYNGEGNSPTYDEAKRDGIRIVAIYDVMVIHKGSPHMAFEIVHKNHVSDNKGAYLNSKEFPTFEISADWILAQVCKPERLVVENMWGPFPRDCYNGLVKAVSSRKISFNNLLPHQARHSNRIIGVI